MTTNDSSEGLPETTDIAPAAAPRRRSLRSLIRRSSASEETAVVPVARIRRRDLRRAERTLRGPRQPVRPLRAVGTMAAVLALLAGVAIPAYAATQAATATASADQGVTTLHDIAEADAQNLTVDASAAASALSSAEYSGTTNAEIEEKKAAAEAAERAQKLAEAAAAAVASGTSSSYVPDTPTDGVVFPLPSGSYSIGRGLGDSGTHEGRDLLAAAGTPIYAIADGVVTSVGCCGAYGNVVFISSNVGGDAVESRYAHMISTPAVSSGQSVTAGQVIGYVGSTGRSTANHLHVEIRINGSLIEPLNWLP